MQSYCNHIAIISKLAGRIIFHFLCGKREIEGKRGVYLRSDRVDSCGVSCGDFLEISGFLGKCAQEEQGSFIWEAARDLFIAGHAYLYTIYI